MILCAGEALIDMLPRQSTEGEDAYAPYAGGAVFNTAIALGRLGAKTAFFSGFSEDFFGSLLKDKLTESHVDHSLALTSDHPCTIAYVKLVDGHATYAFYDENTAGRMLSPGDLPLLPDDVEAVFCGGISLAVEPCGEAYEELFCEAHKSRVTMMDPNIRPSFIRNEPRFRARMDHMLAHADIVKLSDEDLFWLLGDGDLEDHCHTLLDRGVKVVCLTMGADGVKAITQSGTTFVPATRAEVVDTVGAGDTFNAGFMAGLAQAGKLTKSDVAALESDTLKSALSLGARAAAVTVSRAGANPPWANELEA